MTLRSDNADLRLTEKGRVAGAVGDSRWARFQSTRSELARVTELLQSCVLSPEVSWDICRSCVDIAHRLRRNGRTSASSESEMAN